MIEVLHRDTMTEAISMSIHRELDLVLFDADITPTHVHPVHSHTWWIVELFKITNEEIPSGFLIWMPPVEDCAVVANPMVWKIFFKPS